MEREAEYETLRRLALLTRDPADTRVRAVAFALETALTPRQREMARLYYLGQMSMSDVGQRLGVTESTVSRTLKRARARLRRHLSFSAPALLRAFSQDD